MNTSRRRYFGLACLGLVLALGPVSACSSDDGAKTRAGGCGTASGATGSAASGTSPKQGRSFTVKLHEWSITPQAASTAKGKVLVKAQNTGKETHELIVIRGLKAADLPKNANGALDEEKLPKGALLGEIEGVSAGATCDKSFQLAAGDYSLVCNVVDGKKVHLMKGMVSDLRVN